MTKTNLNRSPAGGPTGGLHIDLEDTEAALGECEPWEPWETKLISYSLIFGVLALIILGIIINMTILN